MNRMQLSTVLFLLGASLAAPAVAKHDDRPGRGYGRSQRDGVPRWTRGDQDRLRNLADRLETDTDRFKRSVNDSLDDSRLDGTNREERINDAAQALEDAADRLEKRVDDRESARAAVREVFARANELDALVGKRRLDAEATRDWRRVDADLNVLAAFFPRLAERAEYDRRDRRGDRDWRFTRFDND